MRSHHERADLAPRDVVARAIDFEMKRSGEDCVFLDMTHEKASFLEERFPAIHERCMHFGVDMRAEPIPVVPAAHYMCGGVVVDRKGATSLPGLFALGEVSCSGLHGANRLASNSLLEGLVYGHEVAQSIKSEEGIAVPNDVRAWDVGKAAPSHEAVVVSNNWDEVRRLMWNYVGIVRSDRRLHRAARRIALIREEIREYYWDHLVTRDLLELRNIADVASLVVHSATFRRESRGLHYTVDHEQRLDAYAGDTMLERGVPARLVSR